MNNTGIIECNDIHDIGQQLLVTRPDIGTAGNDTQVERRFQFRDGRFELGDLVPWPDDKHLDREFAAEHRHAAVADVEIVFEDVAGDPVDDAWPVLSDG